MRRARTFSLCGATSICTVEEVRDISSFRTVDEKVLNGTKRFEYCKAVPRNESTHTVTIYATTPVGKVVGEFEVGGVLREKPKDL